MNNRNAQMQDTPCSQTVHETGSNYHIIEYCTGDGVGSVTLKIETSTNPPAINTTVHSVQTFKDGWIYQVKKASGKAVEVEFEDGGGGGDCSLKFKAKYEPGKTTIDAGKMKC